ncbi:hypothetical protein [Pseudomonas chlororaphis]|uniref:hypothetical protein n=1 Tax=Pseudomonas chlororaphis TaxID=587753 RepID=UPI0015DE3F14|nr:hypothetical protein [Pseudomonas chlororaphis]QLL13451.1 hypothetical protein H0I86_31580 [Pseudomonas chlororaphis subsp. aurantiaca]
MRTRTKTDGSDSLENKEYQDMASEELHDITASIVHEANEKLVLSFSVDHGSTWGELVSGGSFNVKIAQPASCDGIIIPFYHFTPDEEFPKIIGQFSFDARQYTEANASISSCYSASFEGGKYGYEVKFGLFNHLGYEESFVFDLASPPDNKKLLRFKGLLHQCPSVIIVFRDKHPAST